MVKQDEVISSNNDAIATDTFKSNGTPNGFKDVNLNDHPSKYSNGVANKEPKESYASTENNATNAKTAYGTVFPSDMLFTSDRKDCVQIRDSYEINEPPVTVPAFLKQIAEKYPKYPALGFKVNDKFQTIDFEQYLETVKTVAKGFLKLGLRRFNSVCILGMNTPEWFYADIGAIMAGGIAAGIYTTNSAEACLHCLKTSYANIIVVENDMQLQKILKIKKQAPLVKAIIQYTGTPSDPSVLSWDDFMKMAQQESDAELDRINDSIAANQCCTILYTSGTISLPKAVMLSHDNLIFNTKVVCQYLEMETGNERILSYLPLSHAAAQIADLYMGIVTAGTVYFADKNVLKGTLVENLRAVRPTILFGVPRVWEKIKEGLEATENKASRIKQFLFHAARATALSHYEGVADGYIYESYLYKFFRRLVYSKVKEALGFDQCKTFLSGAAPINTEVKKFFSSFDMPIGEAYGMSESCGPHVLSKSNDFDFYGAGRALPGVRTKIRQPDENGIGEICMNGRHIFMGYLDEPEKTAESLDEDGWLRSGDTGKVNSKSFLEITGRIKDLLITAGGENVAPALIELSIKVELPVISQAVLIGDGRKYLSVLLTLKVGALLDNVRSEYLNQEEKDDKVPFKLIRNSSVTPKFSATSACADMPLINSVINLDTGIPGDELAPETKAWIKSLGHNYTKVTEIIANKPKEVYDAIQEGLNRVNMNAISAAQRIQKFTILPKDFSVPTGELGPTMKVVRRVVYDHYSAEIEKLYE